jgi:hypothetical protein
MYRTGEISSYKVVKFIVNVRLIENNVNSHVGKVMVVTVIIQYRMLGITRKIARTTRPKRPKVEGDDDSAALSCETEDSTASTTTAELFAIADATLEASMAGCRRDYAAPACT